MAEKISGKKLLALFTHEMDSSKDFSFITGIQPFKISFASKEYFVYIKNISSAYFKNRPDVNRAQLPIREEFYFIRSSNIPFVFLGYDSDNDVYVCWDFYIVKARLNAQNNVSFYSRQSWQNQVQENEFLRKELTNGDKIILFKRKFVIDFFEQIDTFFEKKASIITAGNDSVDSICHSGKLYKITDTELLETLKLLLTGTTLHTLEAIQIVQDFYKDSYPNMTYKDWSTLVKSISF